MFDFFRAWIFHAKVLRHLEEQLFLHLCAEQGGECMGAFATAALNSDIPKDFCETLRRNRVNVQDASVSYFDATITAIKRATPQNASADVATLIATMEDGLDRMFLASPGMLVPRNGKVGASMNEFTTDWTPR